MRRMPRYRRPAAANLRHLAAMPRAAATHSALPQWPSSRRIASADFQYRTVRPLRPTAVIANGKLTVSAQYPPPRQRRLSGGLRNAACRQLPIGSKEATSNWFRFPRNSQSSADSTLPHVVCSSSRITRRNVDSICPAVMAWWRAWLMNVWYRIAAARSGLAANRNQGYLTRPRPSRFA